MTKLYTPGSIGRRMYVLRLKSEVKMSAGPIPPQASLLGVQVASSSLCPHVAFSLCWCIRVHTGQTGLRTPPRPPTPRKGPRFNLITSVRAPSQNTVLFQCTEGQTLHVCILRGHRSARHSIRGHFPARPQVAPGVTSWSYISSSLLLGWFRVQHNG